MTNPILFFSYADLLNIYFQKKEFLHQFVFSQYEKNTYVIGIISINENKIYKSPEYVWNYKIKFRKINENLIEIRELICNNVWRSRKDIYFVIENIKDKHPDVFTWIMFNIPNLLTCEFEY